jgi:FdhD protein
MSGPAPRRRVIAVRGDDVRPRRDRLAGEEPLEVRVAGPDGPGRPVAVTMRTPGDDFALAAGLLVTEGIVAPGTVTRVAYCDDAPDEQLYNVVTVTTSADPVLPAKRSVAATSACGVCGAATLDEVGVRCAPLPPGPPVPRDVLLALPGALRAGQRVFEETGGLHAAGLFDHRGRSLRIREDVGRHNAVDKVVGHAALAGELPLSGRILLVSGRAGFEIVQKAAVAGIAVVASVSAPSSLAADAAERLGVTLVGFLRGDGFNVYAHASRVALGAPASAH